VDKFLDLSIEYAPLYINKGGVWGGFCRSACPSPVIRGVPFPRTLGQNVIKVPEEMVGANAPLHRSAPTLGAQGEGCG